MRNATASDSLRCASTSWPAGVTDNPQVGLDRPAFFGPLLYVHTLKINSICRYIRTAFSTERISVSVTSISHSESAGWTKIIRYFLDTRSRYSLSYPYRQVAELCLNFLVIFAYDTFNVYFVIITYSSSLNDMKCCQDNIDIRPMERQNGMLVLLLRC